MVYINKKEKDYLTSLFISKTDYDDEVEEEREARLSLFTKLNIKT